MIPQRGRSGVAWLLAAPAIGLLLTLFLGPLLLLLRISFQDRSDGSGFYRPGTWSIQAYSELLGEPFGREIIAFTIGLGVIVAGLCVLIGYPLAVFIHTLPRWAKMAALAAVILPKLANVFVVLYGVNLLLGHFGPVNRGLQVLGLTTEPLPLTHNLFGVVLAETYLILPYAVLVLIPALARIDPALLAAARGLGAGPWTAFRRVMLPLSVPGLIVAGQLCLIWALAAFVGPLLLGGPEQATLAVRVQKDGLEYGNWPRAAATAVLSLITVGVCLAIYAWPTRANRHTGGAAHA